MSDEQHPRDPVIEVRTTFASRAAAEDCGRRLVDRALAACVQVEGPLTSVYRWQGGVESAEEWRCVCKTTAAREQACIADILAHHSYETPEILVATVTTSPAYGAWLRRSVVGEYH